MRPSSALTSETYPSLRVITFSYDGANRPSQVSGLLAGAPKTYLNNTSYAPHGDFSGYTYGNGLARTYTYNKRLQPTEMLDKLGPTQRLDLVYDWGTSSTDNGNLYGETINADGLQFQQTFTYDALNRLSLASDTGGWSRQHNYDRYGNMWVTNPSGIPLSGLTPISQSWYNATTNRIVGDGYDNAGNQLNFGPGSALAMAYDAENRQTSVNQSGVGTHTYGYDGEGRRVKATLANGSSTVFVYDAKGDLAAEYTSSAGSAPCTTCYLSWDHLGSTRMTTDGTTGNVVSRHDYLPYGEEIAAGSAGRTSAWGGTEVRQKFTGKERDVETGMDFFLARYYPAAQGRFTSADPKVLPSESNLGEEGFLADPRYWNKYACALNSPLKYTDPDGAEAAVLPLSLYGGDKRVIAGGQLITPDQSAKSQVAMALGPPLALAAMAAGPEAGAIVAGARGLFTGIFGWALGHTTQVQETAAALGEGLSNAAPGSLTSSFARLGANTAESVELKLSGYLLDAEHAVGGTKAEWFQRALGFTKDNLAELAKQITFDPKTAVQTGVTQYGTQYNQVINLVGANGKQIAVTFAWIKNTDGVVRLVTAIPAKQ